MEKPTVSVTEEHHILNWPEEGKDAEQVLIEGSATNGIVALGMAHTRSTSSLTSVLKVALDTILIAINNERTDTSVAASRDVWRFEVRARSGWVSVNIQ